MAVDAFRDPRVLAVSTSDEHMISHMFARIEITVTTGRGISN